VRPNISLGDTLAGLHAAFGAVMALLQRTRAGGGSAPGQVRNHHTGPWPGRLGVAMGSFSSLPSALAMERVHTRAWLGLGRWKGSVLVSARAACH
jgi:hypothetical protein